MLDKLIIAVSATIYLDLTVRYPDNIEFVTINAFCVSTGCRRL